jgi:hypothetical protein
MKHGLERRVSRFSTICAKNQVLKLKIYKVTVIRVTQITIIGDPPCRSMWQLRASETLQKRLSNASETLQERPTSGLHVLLGVFIHCGRFHGQWARCCGALRARVRVRVAAARATANPGFTPPILETPCLKIIK